MEKLLRKFHSQRGETMLMALLLFLVGVMVSAVILAAAISAESDAKAAREEQQAYLTVSSAAELLRDDILSSGYEQKVTRRPTATGSYIERTEVTQTPQGAMKVWLERGIEAVGRGIAYTDVITLTPDAASGLDAVQAEFTMTPAYDITVTLSLADNSQGNCLMTLTLSGQRKQQVTTVTGGNTETGQTTVTTTTISWDTPLIEKGVTG